MKRHSKVGSRWHGVQAGNGMMDFGFFPPASQTLWLPYPRSIVGCLCPAGLCAIYEAV
jgi:hypothetical protein